MNLGAGYQLTSVGGNFLYQITKAGYYGSSGPVPNYIASYDSAEDAMRDYYYHWSDTPLNELMKQVTHPIPKPKAYRTVFQRLFLWELWLERSIRFYDSLLEAVEGLNEQQKIYDQTDAFAPQGCAIHKPDSRSGKYTIWLGGDEDVRRVAEMILDLRQKNLSGRDVEKTTDVFVSKKSADYKLAQRVFTYLKEKGLSVFLSEDCLPARGNSDYQQEIDYALDASRHLVIVGSSAENIRSPWVEAEWRMFINERRAGRKQGNLVVLVSQGCTIDQLPI